MKPRRNRDYLSMDRQTLHIINSMSTVQRAVDKLVDRGFTVVSVKLGGYRPVIWIQHSKRCAELGGGLTYRSAGGRPRLVMGALLDECQVQWDVCQ